MSKLYRMKPRRHCLVVKPKIKRPIHQIVHLLNPVDWIHSKVACLLLLSYFVVDQIENSRIKGINISCFSRFNRDVLNSCPWNHFGSMCAALRLWCKLTIGNISVLQISALYFFLSFFFHYLIRFTPKVMNT